MIYFLRAGESGPVKIGYAVAAVTRFEALQTGHYEELKILRNIEGSKDTEAWLHKHFSKQHIRGEWFVFDKSMLTIEPPSITKQVKSVPADTVMTAAQLIKAGVQLWGEWGWQTRMAERFDLDSRTVRRYVAGAAPVPGPVAVALRLLLQAKTRELTGRALHPI